MVFTPGEWLSHLVSDFHTCWVTFTPAERLSHLLSDFHTCWMTFTPAEWLSPLLNNFHTCCMTFTPAEWLSYLLNGFHTCWTVFTPAADYHSHTTVGCCSLGGTYCHLRDAHNFRQTALTHVPSTDAQAHTLTVGQVRMLHFAASSTSCWKPLTPPAATQPCSGLLLHKGVGNGLHALRGADEDDGGSSAHHQTQVASVFRQLQGVVGIWKTHLLALKQISFFKENTE